MSIAQKLAKIKAERKGKAPNNAPAKAFEKAGKLMLSDILQTSKHFSGNKNRNKVTVGLLTKEFEREHTLLEAHMLVKQTNESYGTALKMVRPTVARLLHMENENKRLGSENQISTHASKCYIFPTNMGIAYEEPGKAIGSVIVFGDSPRFVLNSEAVKGAKGVAVFVPYMTADDFKEDGKDVVIDVPESRLQLVTDFPQQSGFCSSIWGDSRIPYNFVSGEMMTPQRKNARFYLSRIDDGSFVGALIAVTDIFVVDVMPAIELLPRTVHAGKITEFLVGGGNGPGPAYMRSDYSKEPVKNVRKLTTNSKFGVWVEIPPEDMDKVALK